MFKILKVLDNEYKIDILKFYLLLLLVTIFELLAVFIVLPISQVFFKNKIEVDFFLKDFLNNLDFNSLIFISLISLLIIYLIKNKLLIYFAWWKLNFINKFEDKISYRLIKKYLSKDYNFFQNYTAGNFNNYLTNEISNFSSCLLQELQIISEAIIFITIAGLLIFHQSEVTILLIILILITAVISGFFLKKISIKYGEIWVKTGNKINNFAIQCFNSINEIKIYSKIDFFSKIFRNFKKQNLIAKRNASIIGEIPKPIFEFILILCFVLLIYLISKNGNFNQLPEIMSLFLAGAYRLIPAVSRCSTLFQNLKKNEYLINNIIDDLKIYENENLDKNTLKLSFNKSIELKNISFSFPDQTGNKSFSLFNNINININKNQLIGIIGKSGCGKTTLLKIILGFLKPDKGEVLIDKNQNISKNIDAWLQNVSYVTQDPVIIEDTILANISLSHENIDKNNLEKSIDNACLRDVINKFPQGINTFVGPGGVKLSGGQKQRISLARAFYKNSSVIILDEPTSAIDNFTEKQVIKNLLLLKNKTIIMVTHRIDLLDKFDEIVKL